MKTPRGTEVFLSGVILVEWFMYGFVLDFLKAVVNSGFKIVCGFVSCAPVVCGVLHKDRKQLVGGIYPKMGAVCSAPAKTAFG